MFGAFIYLRSNYTFSGTDIAKFGKNIDEILDRNLFINMSTISQFQKTLEVFNRYYKYEQILGSERIEKELKNLKNIQIKKGKNVL